MAAKVHVQFGGGEIAVYELTKPATVLGRDPRSDIHIDNLGISRTHCQFIRRGSAYVLQDLNSSNGTFVNGQRIGEHYLNDQDVVSIGKYTLAFENAEQPALPADAAAGKLVPDSLNTYVMDVQEVRKQMAASAGAAAGAGAPPAAAASRPAAATPPVAPAPALAPRVVRGDVTGAGGGRPMLFLLAVVVILLLVVGLLVYKQLGIRPAPLATPTPPPTAVAPVSPTPVATPTPTPSPLPTEGRS